MTQVTAGTGLQTELLTRQKSDFKDPFRISDISRFSQSIKDGLLYATYANTSKVSRLNKDDILVINPAYNRFIEGCIFVFAYRGNILVRELQILPSRVYKAVGVDDEVFNIDEVKIIGIVAGRITEFFGGKMLEQSKSN